MSFVSLEDLIEWEDETSTETSATAVAPVAAPAVVPVAATATAIIAATAAITKDILGAALSAIQHTAGAHVLLPPQRQPESQLLLPPEPELPPPPRMQPRQQLRADAAVAEDAEDDSLTQPTTFGMDPGVALNLMRQRRLRRGMRDGAMDLEDVGYLPGDGTEWGKAQHNIWGTRLLTDNDPRHEDPVGFKGHLYPPQATLLYAMCALEKRPLLSLSDPRLQVRWTTQAQSNVGVIKAVPSFGKTVMTLALVCAQPVPARLPELCPIVTIPCRLQDTSNNRAVVYAPPPSVADSGFDPSGAGFLPEATIRYKRYLPITIVAAANNVISQWEFETKRFTDKNYFIVENVHTLREFDRMYRCGQVADYDLIFVKAGRVTTSFKVSGEPKVPEQVKNRSLFEAISRILDGVIVGRLVIDDYDTLKLGSDDCFIPALFTWLISATRRQTTAKARIRLGTTTVAEFFQQNTKTSFPILGSALDDVLNHTFSLNCAPSYVNEHLNSTKIQYRRIFVKGGKTAAMLRDLEVSDEIIEMINANAIGTAAQTLGLEAHSVADIIHRVVGVHLSKLRNAVLVLTRTERARNLLGEKAGNEKDKDTIKELRKTLKEGSEDEVDEAIERTAGLSVEVRAALDSLDEWASEQRNKHNSALNRMRDNIREGMCQCCMVPFEKGEEAEIAYVLAGCCQIIVCEPCITKNTAGKKQFIERCPNCSSTIKIPTGLVRVGAELDLETALQDESIIESMDDSAPGAMAGDDSPDAGTGPAGTQTLAEKLDKMRNPKLKVVIQLIQGTHANIDCLHDVITAPYVGGILDGRRNAPWPATKQRKFLVFTMYGESTAELHQSLEEFGIPHCVLRGSRAQKDEAVRLIREEVNVILVTAAKDCGGLNLPFLSHVILYHRVLDKNVETQVTARGQRLGREHNYEIVTILNEAEIEGIEVPEPVPVVAPIAAAAPAAVVAVAAGQALASV